MPNLADPKRGEIWRVNFEPIIGQETNKIRPAIVINGDSFGKLNVRVVIPLTGWDDKYDGKIWLFRVDPSKANGLSKPSAADALAVRSVALERFKERLGALPVSTVDELAKALAVVVEAI